MATADRVLPWRRTANAVPNGVRELVHIYRSRHPKADTSLVTRAYNVAAEAHEGQVRRSGDPYIVHPLAVATILAELGLDDITLAAALLHDAVEDTAISIEDVTADFGAQVAAMVDGVTKLDRVSFESKEAQQAATMRKMLVAMAKDIRVLLIKLADRLHNMRTIAALAREKQERIAQETLDVYAPLAHRLGIAGIKWQLEDLAFATLYPKRYAEIEQMVSNRAPERDIYLSQVVEMVRGRLAEVKVDGEVIGRPKHYWSIYEKMVVKQRDFDEIYDLVGLRVLVGSVKDCYAALGTIHSTWKPVQGRFKDYIAMPKFNLYQSLHTTVVGPQGKPIEVQIRTREMHQRAEYGIAAHWNYKEAAPVTDVGWLNRIVDWQQETDDPQEFMESLKVDLEQDEVFVFTPKGDVVTMALGATPIDFAYAIHTDVGHRCIGARVNGRLVPLDSKLKSGDRVEIFTSKVEGAGPSRDWLQVVVTPRARNKIRQWFSRSRREEAVESGRDDLVRHMRREGLPVQKLTNSAVLAKVAVDLNYADVDALHQAIGENHVSAQSVAQRLARELRGGDHEEQLPATVRRPARSRVAGTGGVHVEGLDDVMVRLALCCTPVPGDEIVGFVTTGRGVSVHRADCANAVTLTSSMGERQIEVEWDGARAGVFVASIEVEALDRARLLGDVSTALADHHVNIVASSTHTGSDRIARLRFDFELADPSHLDALLKSVKRVDSVFDAYRILPGQRR
ncbi:MAG: RelA/SpoT family protein [Acidimicrobiales bacterium]